MFFFHLPRLVWLLPALILAASPVAAESLTPVGVWLHPNQRIEIEIAPCDDGLCAKIIWLKRPCDGQGLPRLDAKNSDPALRNRPLLGLEVLRGLQRAGENSWTDGKVYDPDDGKNYRVQMSITGNGSLHMRAYLLLPMFGETLVWTPVPPLVQAQMKSDEQRYGAYCNGAEELRAVAALNASGAAGSRGK